MLTTIHEWSAVDELPVKMAGIFITRKCNLACSYCSVTRRQFQYELSTEGWQKTFYILDKIGIEKVAILGGEPTIVPGLDRIISYISDETSLDFSVVSNSFVSLAVLTRLIESGLKRYSTSIDSVIGQGYDKSSTAKSNKALQTLVQLKAIGLSNLTGYLVLSKQSINQVEQVANILTELGIWFYLIPFQHGKGNFWENRSLSSQNSFTSTDKTALNKLGMRLKELKQADYKIANSDEYLDLLSIHAINLDWHCRPSTSELRIDADGILMCCNDMRGKQSTKFSILDLEEKFSLIDFQRARSIDAQKCPGCFWPSHFHALQNRIADSITKGVFTQ